MLTNATSNEAYSLHIAKESLVHEKTLMPTAVILVPITQVETQFHKSKAFEEDKAMEQENYSRRMGRGEHTTFFLCAEIFLPYLNPLELAIVSSACKTLLHISKSITAQRISDAARGLEKLPIPFINPNPNDHNSDLSLYSYFIYTKTQTVNRNPNSRQPWGSSGADGVLIESTLLDPFLYQVEDASGCDCVRCGKASEFSCPCFDSAGNMLLTRECGPSCGCESDCGNRETQRGVSVKLKVVQDVRKGWGLYAAALIPHGQFVCEYAGELLSTKEARQRQHIYDDMATNGRLNPALLVVKEHLPSGNSCIRINIDATRIGNVARFINHSCDGGNLDTVIVRSSGALLPRVCFFASRDIQENEELTYSYGESSKTKTNELPCFCGSSSCSGSLPSEHT